MSNGASFRAFGDIEELAPAAVIAPEVVSEAEQSDDLTMTLKRANEGVRLEWLNGANSAVADRMLDDMTEAGESTKRSDLPLKSNNEPSKVIEQRPEAFGTKMAGFRDQDDWCICRSVRPNKGQINISLGKSRNVR
jgi:hypothetical protein